MPTVSTHYPSFVPLRYSRFTCVRPRSASSKQQQQEHHPLDGMCAEASCDRASPSPSASSIGPRKTRSQSPNSLERRRLQNKIAQRKHRQKIKDQQRLEQQLEEERHLGAGAHAMDANSPMDSFDMAAMRPWAAGMQHMPFEAVSPLEPGGLGMWPTDAFACSCNGVTGPCYHHREQIRAQLMAMAAPVTPQRQTMPTDAGFAKMSSRAQQAYPPLNEATGDTGALAQRDANAYDGPHLEMQEAAPPARPSSTGSLGIGPSPSVTSSTASSLNMSPPLWTPSSMCSHASLSQEHSATADGSNDTQITARFRAILDYIQAAGFPDFDSMVTAYYTASFQKGSQAEAAQRVSRCRRLRKMLNGLHESAMQTWPAWEAQGYRDKITEAAQDLYIAEFESLVQGSARQHMSPPQHQMYMFGDMSPEPHYSHIGGHPADLAQGGREDLQSLFRDKVPNLWGLLTEVAATGAQGGQAGAVAAAALSLLCNASPSHATGSAAF